MSKFKKDKALKLDFTYRPIGVIDSIEALVLCLCGKAVAVEKYGKTIKSVSDIFQLPAVIVLKNIFWRDNNQCQYGGRYFGIKDLTVDHIIPKSRSGPNTWTNLTTSCTKCNQKKGAKTPEEAGMKLLNKPFKPKSFLFKNIDEEEISELWSNYLWV